MAGAAGLTLAELSRQKRPVVRDNLRRVLGEQASERELERAVSQAFESYARYWVEAARLVDMSPQFLLRHFSIDGYEQITSAQAAGRGVIIALPHLGSWEAGGRWLSLQGNPMTTVVEPVSPPELFEWMRRQRLALGLEILPLGKQATIELTRRLKDGRVIGLVADRDIAGSGIEVEFFGATTRLPAGPAVLALRTGAALFPAAVYQRPGGYYHGVVRPEIDAKRSGRFRADVEAITAALAREFEELIRAEPAQWHMFQPNWPTRA